MKDPATELAPITFTPEPINRVGRKNFKASVTMECPCNYISSGDKETDRRRRGAMEECARAYFADIVYLIGQER